VPIAWGDQAGLTLPLPGTSYLESATRAPVAEPASWLEDRISHTHSRNSLDHTLL
jgi:hypothetical protein